MHAAAPKSAFLKLHWKKILVGVVALAALAWLSTRVSIDEVHAWTEQQPSWLVFILLVLLPLVGFPVSVLHVVAGIRWGAGVGYALVIVSVALQLLASYALVHQFRPLFEKRLEGVKQKIPPGAHGPVCLFTLLLPGVPYFAKNYVLPLIGVPLRTYLLWCFPIHALRSSIGVLFGNASDDLTPARVAGFGLYAIVLGVSCAWAFRRIREKGGFGQPANAH